MSFKPILRFGVMSDLHYTAEHPLRRERFKDAVETMYSYAEDKEYSAVDALYVVGDFADIGTAEQMTWFKEDCDKYLRPETLPVITLANHELHYVESEQKALSDFDRIFGMPVDRHEIIKGFHFISVTTTRDKGKWHDSFDEAKRTFLKTELKKAAEDGNDRPIFVFQHPGVANTTPGAAFGNLNIYDILAEYPVVIDFSGHSHLAANDPREIFQKDFTAVTTGSLAYISLGNTWCYKNLSSIGYTSSDYSQMLIVEVDEKGVVCVKILDAAAKRVFEDERVIDVSKGKDGFVYTDDRTAPPPVFDDGEVILETTETNLRLAFPKATCDSGVWYYNAKFFGIEGEFLCEKNIPSDHASTERKEVFDLCLGEMSVETATAEIRAVGFFGNISEPLVKR